MDDPISPPPPPPSPPSPPSSFRFSLAYKQFAWRRWKFDHCAPRSSPFLLISLLRPIIFAVIPSLASFPLGVWDSAKSTTPRRCFYTLFCYFSFFASFSLFHGFVFILELWESRFRISLYTTSYHSFDFVSLKMPSSRTLLLFTYMSSYFSVYLFSDFCRSFSPSLFFCNGAASRFALYSFFSFHLCFFPSLPPQTALCLIHIFLPLLSLTSLPFPP